MLKRKLIIVFAASIAVAIATLTVVAFHHMSDATVTLLSVFAGLIGMMSALCSSGDLVEDKTLAKVTATLIFAGYFPLLIWLSPTHALDTFCCIKPNPAFEAIGPPCVTPLIWVVLLMIKGWMAFVLFVAPVMTPVIKFCTTTLFGIIAPIFYLGYLLSVVCTYLNTQTISCGCIKSDDEKHAT